MRASFTLIGVLLFCYSAAAFAQTPDGIPPALETVCDMETGAAFGWCNAYCEAILRRAHRAGSDGPGADLRTATTADLTLGTDWASCVGPGAGGEVDRLSPGV